MNHEITNNPMEHRVVVVAAAGEFSEITAGFWRMFPVQFDCNFTHSIAEQTQQMRLYAAVFEDIWTYVVSKMTLFGCHDLSGMSEPPDVTASILSIICLPFLMVESRMLIVVDCKRFLVSGDFNVYIKCQK